MDSNKRTSQRHWRIEDILGRLNENVDKSNAEEILHSILTSTDILTWNLRGEIVYKGQNIRGTNVVDLLQYSLLPYNPEIPEPAGLNLFVKSLTALEIDKSLIVNARILTMLARKSRQDIHSQDEDEYETSQSEDKSCNNCNKGLHQSHLGTCPICSWTDFYSNCTKCHCMICDFRMCKGDFTHTVACCPHCHCDEIIDVCTDERQLFEP